MWMWNSQLILLNDVEHLETIFQRHFIRLIAGTLLKDMNNAAIFKTHIAKHTPKCHKMHKAYFLYSARDITYSEIICKNKCSVGVIPRHIDYNHSHFHCQKISRRTSKTQAMAKLETYRIPKEITFTHTPCPKTEDDILHQPRFKKIK